MLNFFDRIYIQLYLIATSQDEVKKREWASLILTVMQGFNAFTIYFLLPVKRLDTLTSKFFIAFIAIAIIIFNYIRYQFSERHSPPQLLGYFTKNSKQKDIARNNILLYYVLGTLIGSIGAVLIYRTTLL
jgi:hypothetical protein